MKKNLKKINFNYLYFLFLTFLTKITYVDADTSDIQFKTNNMKCDDLIPTNSETYKLISKYATYFRIIVPILIIVFGSLDFAKAMIAGDDGEMKKSQKRFMIRLGVGILIFFVPTFVNLILKAANSIWFYVNGSTCSI